jgi:SAM-dependent methyltransferase
MVGSHWDCGGLGVFPPDLGDVDGLGDAKTAGMNDNYGIRPDYAARTSNVTVPALTTAQYWTPHRIQMARYYQFQVYRRGQQLIREHSLRSVLDIGCGPALKLDALIAPICNDIVGLDEPGVVEWCQKNLRFGQFLPYDIEREPFPLDRTFDLVICADVIEHLVDPDKLLSDVRTAAHSGSWILLSTPDRDRLRGPGCLHSPKSEHVREWNVSELAAYVSSRGFAVREHTLIAPLKFIWSRDYFAQRWAQWRAGRAFDSCQLLVCQKA